MCVYCFSKSIAWEMGLLASLEHHGPVGLLWGVRGDNLHGHLPFLVPKSVLPFSIWITAVLARTKACPKPPWSPADDLRRM